MKRIALRTALLIAILGFAPACLVLNIHPAYEADSITFDQDLLGAWENADDRVSIAIERGEWNSYRIHYAHPIETGDLTGYLTAVGDGRYLDVMPARGEDRGSFLVPVHAVVKVRLSGNQLEVTPLSYDWFFDRYRSGRKIPELTGVLDQKDNALIVSPTAALRGWLRMQPATGPMFGAPATFTRK